jgi:hypothetical protein
MFVRWKEGKRDPRCGCVRQSAYLIKSVWTDAGPRHKHICYIGSIYDPGWDERCEWHGGPKVHGRDFWLSADRKLAEAGIAGDDLAAIVAGLELAIPRR